MSLDANVVDLGAHQEERFHEETGLPPELWTPDREELSLRIGVEYLRADVGSLLSDSALPADRVIEGLAEELVAFALKNLSPQEAEAAVRLYIDRMLNWSVRKTA